MSKKKNRTFLIKVQVVKVLFYPLIIILDKAGLMKYSYKSLERIIRLFGMKKSVNAFLQYRDYSLLFRNDFTRQSAENKGTIIFPAFFGANSNFTMLDLLFARYYLEKGYKPVFVVCNSSIPVCQKENIIRTRKRNPFFCYECWNGYKKIAEETGIEILYLNDLQNRETISVAEKAFTEIERLKTSEECRRWVFNGLPAGELSYKSVLRFQLQGTLSDSTDTTNIYRKFLRSTIIIALAMEELFRLRGDIRKAIIHNGTLAHEATMRIICHRKGIPYMTFETYMGERALIYKKNDEVMLLDWQKEMRAFYAETPEPADMAEEVDRFFSELRVGKHKYAVLNKQAGQKSPNPFGRYVCAFTNLNFDTAVIGKHTIFSDMEEWLVSLVSFWEQNVSDINLVIRVHPAEVRMRSGTREFMGEKLRERIKADNIILIDSDEKANAYDLIESMDYGLVYSSTIGMEIAYADKTCVVAGKPYFRDTSFVLTPASKEDYFNKLTRLNRGEISFKPDRNTLIRMAYYIFRIRLKELNGIKVFTLNAEKNTVFETSEEMLKANMAFLDEFESEFSLV